MAAVNDHERSVLLMFVCVCACSSVFSVYVHACVCEGRGMLYAFVVKWIRDTVCDVVIVRVRKQRLR